MLRLPKPLRHIYHVLLDHGVLWPVMSLILFSAFGIKPEIASDALRSLWLEPPAWISHPLLRTGLPVVAAVWLMFRLWKGSPGTDYPAPTALSEVPPGNAKNSTVTAAPDGPKTSLDPRFQAYIAKLAQEGSALADSHAFMPNHVDLRAWLSSAKEVRDQLEARYRSNRFCNEIDSVNTNRDYREQVREISAILKRVVPAIESGVLLEQAHDALT